MKTLEELTQAQRVALGLCVFLEERGMPREAVSLIAPHLERAVDKAISVEREECAKVAETVSVWNTGMGVDYQHEGSRHAREAIARAIRERE